MTEEPVVNAERMRRSYEETRDEVTRRPVITQRAVAHIEHDLHMVGRIGTWELESDEPPEAGGDGRAVRPLQYIVAGAAF